MNHEKKEIVDIFMEVVGEAVYGEEDYYYNSLQLRSLAVHNKLLDTNPSYAAAFNKLSAVASDLDQSALIKRLELMSEHKDSVKKHLKAILMIAAQAPTFVRLGLANWSIRKSAMPAIEREFFCAEP